MEGDLKFIGNLTDLCKRLNCAVLVVDVHDGDQHCGVADCAAKLLKINPSVSVYWQIGCLETALFKVLTGMQNGVMLYGGGNDMIACTATFLQLGQTFDGMVICFGATSRKDNFAGTFGTDKFGDLFACSVDGGARFASVGVDAGTVAECLSEIWHHGIADFGAEWGCGVVI